MPDSWGIVLRSFFFLFFLLVYGIIGIASRNINELYELKITEADIYILAAHTLTTFMCVTRFMHLTPTARVGTLWNTLFLDVFWQLDIRTVSSKLGHYRPARTLIYAIVSPACCAAMQSPLKSSHVNMSMSSRCPSVGRGKLRQSCLD